MTLFLKNLIFTLIAPATVAVYVPVWIARDRSSASGLLFLPGLVLLAAGGAMYLWCVWDFATFGRGTPAPIDAPKRLVVRGLYRHVRNPMYVGVLTMILGWTLIFHAPTLLIYALCVWTVTHLFVVLYEERHLRELFGSEYEDYCRTVNRWLPRL